MSELNNSKVLIFTIDTLIKIIGKRTSPSLAYQTLNKVINKIQPKYDYLRFVEIKNSLYSETGSEIIVDPEIDKVDPSNFLNCIKDIADYSTKEIGENADFFFIRELRDNLKYENEPIVRDLLLNLNARQHEYIFNRKEEIRRGKIFFDIKNSDIVEPVIKSLIYLLSKINSNNLAEEKVISILNKYKESYNFLNYIKINYNAEDKSLIFIETREELDDISSLTMAEALEKIIEEIGKLSTDDLAQSFIDDFKIVLGENNTHKLIRLGVDFTNVKNAIKYQNRRIAIKVLKSLIDVLSQKTTRNNAITMIGETIVFFQGIHNILNYVQIDTTNIEEGKNFTILAEINSIESYKLGSAFRDVISMIQKNHKKISLIDDFKKQLGNDYLIEIEKLGVNLHFLELKYSFK